MIQMKEQIKREREVLLKEQNKRIERLEVSLAWDWAWTTEQSPRTAGRAR